MTYILIAIGICVVIPILLLLNRKYMHRLVDRRIASYQNELATRHYEEVENIYKQMRGWRHDYHNHIQMMKAYLTQGQTKEMGEYLNKLDADLTSVDTILKTGNVMIDAILNSKISLARTKDISVNAKAIVPKKLSVPDIDLCVVIGNLLDNAIEACANLSENRFIRVYVGVHKEMLYISVTNAMSGEIEKTGNRYLTTKSSGFHGFGLDRVDKITEKYSGFVNRQYEEGVFATEVMLPL